MTKRSGRAEVTRDVQFHAREAREYLDGDWPEMAHIGLQKAAGASVRQMRETRAKNKSGK